jgi:hypothetical protein
MAAPSVRSLAVGTVVSDPRDADPGALAGVPEKPDIGAASGAGHEPGRFAAIHTEYRCDATM